MTSIAFPRDQLLSRLAAPVLAAAEKAELGVSISVIDPAGASRIYVSDAAARLLGYSVDELIGSSTFLTFAPEEVDRMHAMSQRWRRGEAIPYFLETIVLRKDGSRVPIEVAYSIVELDGTPATVAFLRDISERKRTEEALTRSESLFRKLVEAAPEAVLVARENRVAYVNPRFLALLGYERLEDVHGRTTSEFIHPDDQVLLAERQRLIEDSPDPVTAREYRLVRSGGDVISVECSSLRIEFEGSPAILTFLRDITERKEAQTRMIQTDRMATIGTLAAGVAHELNNPLAYVLLNLGILDRELDQLSQPHPEVSHLKGRVATAREGAERMASIVRDLRGFCRPNTPALAAVDLQQLLDSSINMAMNELRDRATVVRDYGPLSPVIADAPRLGQVFLNLLLNAAQALPEGSPGEHVVRVLLRAEPDGLFGGRADGRVRIEISDTGHGMTPEIVRQIFEPFFTTKPVGIGTGLGLPICQSIVHSMEGEITVRSEPGRGSTFRVVLPRVAAIAEAPSSDTKTRVSAAIGPRLRVLVVDDEPAIAHALKKILEEHHDVAIVTSGAEAIALLNGNGSTFDAILCDVLMPGKSGIDVHREVQSRVPDAADRMIFMTGAASMQRVADFLDGVPNPRLDKPVDLSLLLRLVRNVSARGAG